ncbi:hypothetical protein AW736_02850 [Termitidicoccus mucosus]|uniref:Uncharacterized protein n=1 Tax=Termitidicoccus mucosus TaxID=1184151 RepID=A0A178IQ70_9BACT|nr:hypothetical protein AW736_02850 [Opitutaceae bacterium TSB47]
MSATQGRSHACRHRGGSPPKFKSSRIISIIEQITLYDVETARASPVFTRTPDNTHRNKPSGTIYTSRESTTRRAKATLPVRTHSSTWVSLVVHTGTNSTSFADTPPADGAKDETRSKKASIRSASASFHSESSGETVTGKARSNNKSPSATGAAGVGATADAGAGATSAFDGSIFTGFAFTGASASFRNRAKRSRSISSTRSKLSAASPELPSRNSSYLRKRRDTAACSTAGGKSFIYTTPLPSPGNSGASPVSVTRGHSGNPACRTHFIKLDSIRDKHPFKVLWRGHRAHSTCRAENRRKPASGTKRKLSA